MAKKNYEAIVEALIRLKDNLKREGYHWQDLQCINDACNVLEHLGDK